MTLTDARQGLEHVLFQAWHAAPTLAHLENEVTPWLTSANIQSSNEFQHIFMSEG